MDNKLQINLIKKESVADEGIKKEQPDALISKKGNGISIPFNEPLDKKDLLIAKLQEQIAKQKECISYYESIVQLMNYKLMKLKKVLKAHQLLEELEL